MNNNNILIGHLGWDGAHFLGACLSMSEKIYFNNLTSRGKVEYFFKNMANVFKENDKPVWSDVFMFSANSYQTKGSINYHQALINDFDANFEQFEFDSKSEEKSFTFGLHVPIYYPLENLVKKKVPHPVVEIFQSKYFICLINSQLFSSLRGIKIKEEDRNPNRWDKDFARIPDIKWYNGPLTEIDYITNSITVSEFQLLSKEMRESIISYHNRNLNDLFNLTKLYKSDNDFLKTMITHTWDCNWFLTEDDTVKNIEILYSEMNLGTCNQKLIREMYKIWMNKIDYLKKWHIKKTKYGNDRYLISTSINIK